MNTTQIIEQDKIIQGEIVKEEPCSSTKCKVEVQYFKYWAKPHQYTVVKPKKVKNIITPEMTRERNRTSQRKCRDRKRSLKQLLESKNPPKNPPKNLPLTLVQRSKRYRDKKKNQKKI